MAISNPKRFPKNIAGEFYTTGTQAPSSDAPNGKVWMGDCLSCEAPESEAPQLLARLDQNNSDTYFVQQPNSPDDVAAVCRAMKSCCTYALRYGGRDVSIIRQLNNDPLYCDHIISADGTLVETLDSSGDLLPFALKLTAKINGKLPLQLESSDEGATIGNSQLWLRHACTCFGPLLLYLGLASTRLIPFEPVWGLLGIGGALMTSYAIAASQR